MAITKAKKTEIVNDLVEKIKESQAIYLVDYSGIPVGTDNALRKIFNTKSINYKVSKNTLIKRALSEAGIEGLDDLLVGVSAILLGDSEDPMLPAKEVVAFLKENNEAVTVKGINLDGEVLAGDQIDAVAKMPGRLELIAEVVSIACGPGATLVGLFKGPGSTIAGQLKALEEKLEN
jgi:large subunit ribosomal protein L10